MPPFKFKTMSKVKSIKIKNVEVSVDCQCTLKELTHSFGEYLTKDELKDMHSKLNQNDRTKGTKTKTK